MRSKLFDEEKGIALITTLMCMVLGFAVVITLMLLVTQATRLSAVEQRYTSSLEAAKGGVDFFINMIRNDLVTPPNNIVASAAGPSGSACLRAKMTRATASWGSYSSTPCPTENPDITMTVAGNLVSIKLVDTRETSTHYFYTVHTRATAPNGTGHAEISFLYMIEK